MQVVAAPVHCSTGERGILLSGAEPLCLCPNCLNLALSLSARARVQACTACCQACITVHGCNAPVPCSLYVSVLQMGLEPTHQVVRLARDAGFGNVHDYLVHLVTGRSSDCEHASATLCGLDRQRTIVRVRARSVIARLCIRALHAVHVLPACAELCAVTKL